MNLTTCVIMIRKNKKMLSSHRAGFTLLEVMVALAILATAFTAVLRLHSDSMELVISSRISSKAAELAQFKMTEIKNTGLKSLPFLSGSFSEFAPDYVWEARVEPTSFDSWAKVVVVVKNKNIAGGGEFRLTAYMSTAEPGQRTSGK
ncbi:prepilin-type N-terminal cleavage/methylation domain-containing protein [Thermodesulfobacteriota bacterium]